MSRAVFTVGLIAVLVIALAFRMPALDNRPMHADEAVHAFKFRELWERGVYRYDPTEFHGPTLYYATLPVVCLSGARRFADTREVHYRLVTVVFGAGLVLLLTLLADGLGKPAALFAGVLTAISPAFVFYSRYYIQEALLVFFTLGMLGSGWRYFQSGKCAWSATAGFFAGLMVATKETAVLAFGATAVALAVSALWNRRAEKRSAGFQPDRSQDTGAACPQNVSATCYIHSNLRPMWNFKHAIVALVVGVLTASVLLSGFCTNLSAPLDYLNSYTSWLHRARGAELHSHPWYYYLQLLIYTHRGRGPVFSEGLIVGLAVVGIASSFTRAHFQAVEVKNHLMLLRLLRFVTSYTIALTAAYSLIPYKTPWCALSFLNGMTLLAGLGAVALYRIAASALYRVALCIFLTVGCAQLGWQAYRTCYVYYTDGHNPYVYAQTVPDIVDLQERMVGLARIAPQREAMVVKVFSNDPYYWPLPWYLRQFPNVGYWTDLPDDINASVVIASPEFERELMRRLDDTHVTTGYYGLRPTIVFEMWVQTELWNAYLQTRKLQRQLEPRTIKMLTNSDESKEKEALIPVPYLKGLCPLQPVAMVSCQKLTCALPNAKQHQLHCLWSDCL